MRRSPRNRPARRFAVRTAWVLVAIGIAVHALVVQTIDAELNRQLEFRGEFVIEYLLAPAAEDGALTQDTIAEVVADDPQVTGITVRRPDGSTVGSAGSPAATDVRHRLTIPDSGGLIATIRQDDAVVQAAATDLTRRLTLVLTLGLGLLWAAIVPLAYRLGRELRGQAEELREQSAELRRLLGREQMTVRRLQEVDELRDRFLESISHELRTPLTVVKGALTTLLRHGSAIPGPVQTELLERATQKAQRLDELVLGLLEMNQSREEADEHRVVAIPEVIRAIRTQLPPRDVELDLDVTAIVTNPTRLGRTLGHLLGNAIRHAPDDALIVIRTHVAGTNVELQVDDRGPGIPDGLKHAVFDPFRQGDLHDAHSPGIGMGLSLVARFAAEHGGRAWITDRPGGGTRVHLLLKDVLPGGLPGGEAGGSGAGGGATRLLLDDEPASRVEPGDRDEPSGDGEPGHGGEPTEGRDPEAVTVGARSASASVSAPTAGQVPTRRVVRRVVRRRAPPD